MIIRAPWPLRALFAPLLFGGALLVPAQAESLPGPVAPQAEPFDLNAVHLLESPFKRAQETTQKLLLSIDSDLMLYPFRREAGLPSPVQGENSYFYAHTGHILGHYLSASAQLYRNTGDVAVKQKADALVATLSECQAKMGNGYLGGFPEKAILHLEGLDKDPQSKADVPWYCLHKVYAGLLDMYVLAGNAQALDILKKAADWADRNLAQLKDNQVQLMLGTEHGGMNEVLANLYAITREEKYLRLSLRFNHRSMMDPFLKGQDPMDLRHANTQIPKFMGPALQYLLTGDANHKEVATRFWSSVTENRSYVTGANSLYEHFTPKGELSHFVNGWTGESCNEYNMLKLTRVLFSIDPRPEYMDYYERTLYNHVLSTRQPETGGQLYFQVLQTGHFKGEPGGMSGWRYAFNGKTGAAGQGGGSSCCSGSGLESNTKYTDTIYFHHGAKELYINLFIPSVLDWREAGLTLKQETNYPEEGRSRFTFSCKQAVRLAIHIRRPWWATTDFRIVVNGRPQAISGTSGSGYALVERTWQDGDKLEVIMPLSFRMEGFTDNPQRAAVMYGPLVMAGITEYRNPFSVIQASDEQFLQTLQPVEGKALEFTAPASIFRTSPFTVANRPLTLRPFYATFGDAYALYWDIVAPATFTTQSAILQAELDRIKSLDAQTVDAVFCEGNPGGTLGKGSMFTFRTYFLNDKKWLPRPAQDYSEKAHEVKASKVEVRRNSYVEIYTSELFFGLLGDFRMIEPGKSCSYRLKVLPEVPQTLQVRLWKPVQSHTGSKSGNGIMEVLLDEQLLGVVKVDALPPGQFTSVNFPLPEELTKAKNAVEVLLRVPAQSPVVGGISECRIVKP
jgi:DUF1680 family protein